MFFSTSAGIDVKGATCPFMRPITVCIDSETPPPMIIISGFVKLTTLAMAMEMSRIKLSIIG